MKISVFNRSARAGSAPPDDLIEDWEDLCDLLTYVKEGPKDGQYYVRGFCDGSRSDDNITAIDLIIIDGDSTITNGASCVPPQQVHEVMKAANIRHIIHTSYSNDLVNNRNKWRMIIPCSMIVDAESLRQGVREIIAGLHRGGLPVRNVKENNTLSQPWYTPRCPIGHEDEFWCATYDGEEYSLTGEDAPENNIIQENKREDSSIFNWGSIMDIYRSGSLHQGMLSSVGWLIMTSDWSDSQIQQFVENLITVCPDQKKVNRALSNHSAEIKEIIKHCRKKSGLTVEAPSDWRDGFISAAELKGKEFPPVKWAVDDLIPEGLTVLAGDPKVGKSLLAVDICSAISSGGEAFGCQGCVRGTAIYVSMEDPERRVKARIKQMVDVWEDSFKIVTSGIPKVGIDFYKMLDDWMLLCNDVRCIIFDTMSFILPEKKNGVTDYDHYYSVLDPLHRWALDNGVAVVCITHKRKGTKADGDNPFDGIIGSTAISGCSDAMIMLTKNHAKAKDSTNLDLADGFLDVTGREIAAEHFSLEFDSEAIKWALRGRITTKDITSNPNHLLILDSLKDKKLKQREISEKANLNINTVKSALRKMKSLSLINNDEEGWYRPDINYEEAQIEHENRWGF